MAVLSPELRAWVTPGLAGVIAIIDASALPRVARIWAARILDGDILEIGVQRSSALPVLEALAERRQAAVNVIEVTTYRSRMFRGPCELAPTDPDMAFVEACVAAQARAFQAVGMTADAADRMLAHGDAPRAMVAIHVHIESVFDQSPKPGAGARL
jgi:hypothetical protein